MACICRRHITLGCWTGCTSCSKFLKMISTCGGYRFSIFANALPASNLRFGCPRQWLAMRRPPRARRFWLSWRQCYLRGRCSCRLVHSSTGSAMSNRWCSWCRSNLIGRASTFASIQFVAWHIRNCTAR